MFSFESCAGLREGANEAMTEMSSGQPSSFEIITLRVFRLGERQMKTYREVRRTSCPSRSFDGLEVRRTAKRPFAARLTAAAPFLLIVVVAGPIGFAGATFLSHIFVSSSQFTEKLAER